MTSVLVVIIVISVGALLVAGDASSCESTATPSGVADGDGGSAAAAR